MMWRSCPLFWAEGSGVYLSQKAATAGTKLAHTFELLVVHHQIVIVRMVFLFLSQSRIHFHSIKLIYSAVPLISTPHSHLHPH